MSNKESRYSLSGKNAGRITGGARSSRANSTLFKKLRELDRKISHLTTFYNTNIYLGIFNRFWHRKLKSVREKIIKLDQKRCIVRNERKKFQKELIYNKV
tara:strand:+ start:54 stop:353 length:300 start_codon:yes stop_codon:yes gene_type:complete